MSKLGLDSVRSALSNTVSFFMDSVKCVRVNYDYPFVDGEDLQREKDASPNTENEKTSMDYDAINKSNGETNTNENSISQMIDIDPPPRRKRISLHILVPAEDDDILNWIINYCLLTSLLDSFFIAIIPDHLYFSKKK